MPEPLLRCVTHLRDDGAYEQRPTTGTEALYESYSGDVHLWLLPTANRRSKARLPGISLNRRWTSAPNMRFRRRLAFSSRPRLTKGSRPSVRRQCRVYDRIGGSGTIELSRCARCDTESDDSRAGSVLGCVWRRVAVFFTSSAELTTSSNTGTSNGGEDLYEYSFARAARGEQALVRPHRCTRIRSTRPRVRRYAGSWCVRRWLVCVLRRKRADCQW